MERVTTCRVGVVVSGLARHCWTDQPAVLRRTNEPRIELNAPVRIAELAIGGSGQTQLDVVTHNTAWRGTVLPHTWIVPRVRGGTSRLTTTQLPGQAQL